MEAIAIRLMKARKHRCFMVPVLKPKATAVAEAWVTCPRAALAETSLVRRSTWNPPNPFWLMARSSGSP